MAEGRQRHDWSIASAFMALVANTQRDPKRSRPIKPSDLDPFARPRRAAPTPKVGVSVLRDVFIDGRMPAVAATSQEGASCG